MIRSSLRALVLPGLAGALLAGCATNYAYRAGPGGDYYYGQPEVHYNDPYGYGYGYGWYGWGGGGPYGWGPYGYWGGYPYGPYWGPYWGPHHHVYHPVVPPPGDPPPPNHGPRPGISDGHDRGPDRPRPPGPVTPGHPVVRPMPAAPHVVVPRPVTGMSEREPHRKTTP